MKRVAFVVGVLAVCCISSAQFLSWSTGVNIGNRANGWPQAAAVAPDGSIYLAMQDGCGGQYITHNSATGTLLWQRNFGPAGFGLSNVSADANGAFVANATSRGVPSGAELYVARYDTNGNRVWTWFRQSIPFATGIVVSADEDASGNLYVFEYARHEAMPSQSVDRFGDNVYKLLPNGQLAWTRSIASTVQTQGAELHIDHAGNLVFLTDDAKVIKMGPDGSTLWTTQSPTYAKTAGGGYRLQKIASDDSIYLTTSGIPNDILEHYSSGGNLVWSATLPTSDVATSVVPDTVGRVYVTGQSGFAALVDATGHVLWSQTGLQAHYAFRVDGSNNLELVGTGSPSNPSQVVYEKLTPQGAVTGSKTASQVYPTGQFSSLVSAGGRVFALNTGTPLHMEEIDTSGSPLWQSTFSRTSGDGIPLGAALDAAGNSYLIGEDQTTYQTTRLVCISSLGQAQFYKTLDRPVSWGGPFGQTSIGSNLSAFKPYDNNIPLNTSLSSEISSRIQCVGNGLFVYLDGYWVNGLTTPRFERLDLSGNKLWEYVTSGDYTRAFTVDSAQNIYAAGASLYKINGSGALVFKTTLPTNAAPGDNIALDSAQNIYVSAKSKLLKYNAAGVLQWTYTAGITATPADFFANLRMSPDGNLVGCENVYAGGNPFGIIKKFSPTGALLWSLKPSYPNATEAPFTKCAVDANNNIYAAGSALVGNQFILVVYKINSSGQLLWSKPLNYGPQTISGNIAIDPSGNVVVGGNRYTAATGSDYFIAKIDPNGNLLKVGAFNNSINLMDRELGFNMDSQGDSYLWGWSTGSTGVINYHVAKYLTSQ